MKKSEKSNDYFDAYSQKWERALMDKRYGDALIFAIRGYLVSRDFEEQAYETATLAYMAKAIDCLTNDARKNSINADKKHQRCSFCGRGENEVRLMAGADANICNECVARIHGFFEEGKAST